MKTKLTKNYKANDGLNPLRYLTLYQKSFSKLECETEKVPEIDGLKVKARLWIFSG